MPPSPPATDRSLLNRLALLLALLLSGFALIFLLQSWRSEREDQIAQLRTVLAISQKAVDRHFQQLEAGLKNLAIDVDAVDGQPQAATLARELLRRFHGLHPELSATTWLRADGQVLASSVNGPADSLPTLAAEPSFERFRAEIKSTTTLDIGRPLLGPVSRRWIIPLRYVLRDDQGRPHGVLVASMPVALLQEFWQDAPIIDKASIGLLRDDGYLLSRYPVATGVQPDAVYGRERGGALRQHLRAASQPASGYVEGYNQLGGANYGNVFQRLDHYPLTLFVSLPVAEYRRAWWQLVEVPLLLLALLGVGGWIAYRRTLARQEAWAAERQRNDAELRSREEEQRALLEQLPAGVVVHRPDGTVLRANPQACRLIGLSEAQMQGKAVIDPSWRFLRADGSDMPVDEYPASRVVASQAPVSDLIVGVLQPGSGARVWLIVNAFPRLDDERTLRQVVVCFVDITPLIHAEQTLERSESRYRMLFANSLDGVLQTRPDGSILTANPAACAMFGMTEAELCATGRQGVVDHDDPRLRQLVEARRQHGHALGRLRMRRQDGRLFEAEISSSLYRDAGGDEIGSIIVRDVSAQHEAEAALRARDLAEQANRAKSDFVARMSHELRTPLNAILGFAEILQLDREHPLDAVQQQRLLRVRDAGGHLLSLIDDLLDLSRIEAGTLHVQLEDVDLGQVVDEVVRTVASLADAHRVRVAVEPRAQAPGRVRGDRTRLRQVLLNLLSNAIKYNRPDGEVRLRLHADDATGRVRLTVVDTGLGMSEAQLQALFEPFNRLGREQSRVEGTGIGLVITRSLVELMGGTLAVTSRPGVGSEFSVELRSAGSAAPAAAGDAAAPQARRTDVRGRVLYMDDDEVNRLVMQAYLELRPGVTLDLATDGASGLALAARQRPDLMLIDMRMPPMNGVDVLRAVRAAPALRAIPCIAVSANAMPAEIDEALAAGFDAYLTKPLSAQALLAEIDRRL